MFWALRPRLWELFRLSLEEEGHGCHSWPLYRLYPVVNAGFSIPYLLPCKEAIPTSPHCWTQRLVLLSHDGPWPCVATSQSKPFRCSRLPHGVFCRGSKRPSLYSRVLACLSSDGCRSQRKKEGAVPDLTQFLPASSTDRWAGHLFESSLLFSGTYLCHRRTSLEVRGDHDGTFSQLWHGCKNGYSGWEWKALF